MGGHFRVGLALVLIVVGLPGCNFAMKDEADELKRPTLGTPIAWATAYTEIVPPTTTPTVPATLTPAPSTTPSPAQNPPTVTTAPTLTVAPPASLTPAPTLTAVPPTAAPTLTRTPFAIFTGTTYYAPPPSFTPAPPVITDTPAAPVLPTSTTTTAPGVTYAPPPSFTPVIGYTAVASAPGAQVCATCSELRLRDAPGTAGGIIGFLDANTPLTLIGRTADNTWVQIVLADGRNGWVAAQYLTITIDLNVLSVTGTAQDAPSVGPATIDIVSGVTSNSRQIFLDGRAKGNLVHVFTRVGDSMSASPNFLMPIGTGNYRLGDYAYLGGAISFFSGPNGRGQNPFAASSIAARNSWSTESVLNPANADPGLCAAGETPLACEYRVNRPSVALIMLGTNDAGGMPLETFRANLSRIVQISINMGVIPVLSTIPPKHYNPATDGRVGQFNQVIVAVAQGYDVPLWNYWLAMSRLPGEGLAADGVHPSSAADGLNAVFDVAHLRYGYPTRNLTALQVLYTLWQQVLYDGDQAPAATAPPATQPVIEPGGGDTSSCALLLPPQLTAGGQGQVTPGLPNKVRSQPGTAAAQVGNIPGEGVFSVLDGPACADSMWWWQVDYQGLVGWTANGDAAEYWVRPYP